MTTTVICAYHEGADPSFNDYIFRYPKIFLPILGGSCYYKRGSNNFYDKLQVDDTGENISNLVIYINEHAPLYWAYKHYEEIGNPDMIGLCHYRRFMDVDYENLDPTKVYANLVKASHYYRDSIIMDDTVFNTYANFCSDEITEFYVDAYRNWFPEYVRDFDMVLNDITYYAKNMFIMNRETFFEFMAYIVRVERMLFDPALFKEACSIYFPAKHLRRLMLTHSRCRGFLLEMFTAVWFSRQKRIHNNVVNTEVLEFKRF